MRLYFHLGLLCALLALASTLSLSFIRQSDFAYFASSEPFYAMPITASSRLIRLRNDDYGKGAFGVSRSGGRKHKGLDFLAEEGSPVVASKSGRVQYAGYSKGYGLYVILNHPDGLSTRYAHLQKLYAQTGAWIRSGAAIGAVGKSGNADHPKILPHLHFEIRYGQTAVNPTHGHLDPTFIIQ